MIVPEYLPLSHSVFWLISPTIPLKSKLPIYCLYLCMLVSYNLFLICFPLIPSHSTTRIKYVHSVLLEHIYYTFLRQLQYQHVPLLRGESRLKSATFYAKAFLKSRNQILVWFLKNFSALQIFICLAKFSFFFQIVYSSEKFQVHPKWEEPTPIHFV